MQNRTCRKICHWRGDTVTRLACSELAIRHINNVGKLGKTGLDVLLCTSSSLFRELEVCIGISQPGFPLKEQLHAWMVLSAERPLSPSIFLLLEYMKYVMHLYEEAQKIRLLVSIAKLGPSHNFRLCPPFLLIGLLEISCSYRASSHSS